MSEPCGCQVNEYDPTVLVRTCFLPLHARAERTQRERDALLVAAIEYRAAQYTGGLSVVTINKMDDAIAACEKE